MDTINLIVEKALKEYLMSNEYLTNNNKINVNETDINKSLKKSSLKQAKKRFLKNYLKDLLFLCYGNVSLAAEKAKINRRQLHRLLKDLEIDAKKIRQQLIKPSEYLKENLSELIEKNFNDKNDISDTLKEIIQNFDFPYEIAINSFEKELINLRLKQNQYNVDKTAQELNISPRTLYRKIRA